MKSMLLVLIFQIIFGLQAGFAQIASTNNLDLQRMEDQLREVRRDQLNYQIEKNLLKEAYSSNLQVINGALAFFLGIISIIGFFGIRDINTMKREYMKELDEFRHLRIEFEGKVKEVGAVREKVEAEFKEITKVNNAQEQRIKVLEIQEKVWNLISAGNFQRALEYIAIGLDLDAKNVMLLNEKATALWRSGQYMGALGVYKEILKNDPGDVNAAANAMEVALFAGALDEFNVLLERYKGEVAKLFSGELDVYFQVLASYQSNNTQGAINQLKQFLSSETEQKKRAAIWAFSDAVAFISRKPASPGRDAILEFINVMNGVVNPKVALEKINTLFPNTLD